MDPIADMLIRITNAQAVHAASVFVPFSTVKFRIAQLLTDAGYLGSVERRKRKARKAELEWLELGLKYLPDGQAGDRGLGAISGTRLVSRPSRHLYTKSQDIRPVRSGYGLAVLSTSKGIMSGADARREHLGGEMLFEIW